MTGSRKTAIIEPSRSALVIIDMQEFFLNPELSPRADGGRTIVQATLNMIAGFRAKGMKVLWVNWGLDQRDLREMPPALLAGFSDDDGPLSKLHTYQDQNLFLIRSDSDIWRRYGHSEERHCCRQEIDARRVECKTLRASICRANQGCGGRHRSSLQQKYCPTRLSRVEHKLTR
jgi:nicotinamidase-related amidase